eukprot:CAMPEP_0198547574 /NCGR_PEP_ID=MMETSP1462-20131121/67628_1 /TAXON_ID=1333877 /ORGANISM="Brandtodinium nutriculum, Strain RCC3387" /LENGTH=60 /DNA_ID=CAMNT_0044278067 /DNA_START=136 /DNA_END=318 /DNA_ORIENTATION=+
MPPTGILYRKCRSGDNFARRPGCTVASSSALSARVPGRLRQARVRNGGPVRACLVNDATW